MMKDLKKLLPSLEQVHEKFCELSKIEYNSHNLINNLTWNCSGAAHAAAKLIKIDGLKIKTVREIYGIFHGLSVEHGKIGFYRHAWLLINEKYIVDPTRWVFHGKLPKMYICEKNNRIDYDEAMVKFRSQISRPFPESKGNTSTPVTFNWSFEMNSLIQTLTMKKENFNQMYMNQVLWLGNLPPDVLGHLKNEMYEVFKTMGFMAFVPVDYRKQYEFELQQSQ